MTEKKTLVVYRRKELRQCVVCVVCGRKHSRVVVCPYCRAQEARDWRAIIYIATPILIIVGAVMLFVLLMLHAQH
jgi:hypothetical protein